jgi:hypothetical protein
MVRLKVRRRGGTPYRMVRARVLAVLVVTATASSPVRAQPSDPYAPAGAAPVPPAPLPADQDPALAEQIAANLVERADTLFEQRMFADAKQLAVEALVKAPKGRSADRARMIIKAVNQQLGIQEEPEPTKVEPTPVEPTKVEPEPGVAGGIAEQAPISAEGHDGTLAARVHGGLYAGLLGATVGSFIDSDHPARGAVPVGVVTGLVGAWYFPKLFTKWHWDEAQVRTIGAGSLWGGVVGGLFTEVVTGAGDATPSAPGILVGASVGATAGMVAGGVLARDHKLTRGDIALTDTLAGIGTAGGLTIGMLMQPAQKEAYALNAALGAAGGVIAGYVAGPQTNTTPRRMLRVAGLAAAGGALPFALYAGIHDKSSHGDERLTGALSSLGMVGGAWLGFWLTRHMDAGKDVQDGAAAKSEHHDDVPPATVMHTRDGWQVGGVGLQPLSPVLAPQQGMTLSLLGGVW